MPLSFRIACCLIIAGGCEPVALTPVATRSNASEKPIEIIIRPGYGSAGCYIGMSFRDLSQGWRPASEAFPDVYSKNTASRAIYYNKREDTLAGCKDGSVVSIVYQFKDDVLASIERTTNQGIDRNSIFRDVFMAYGSPESIVRLQLADTKKDTVFINYMSAGILFEFFDSSLASITIRPKEESPFDPIDLMDRGNVQELRKMCEEVIQSELSK